MPVAVGNRRLMEQAWVCAPVQPQQAGTVVFVAVDGAYAGWILLGDVVKAHAQAAIRGLKAEGVAKTVMLTGDAEAAARQVADELGRGRDAQPAAARRQGAVGGAPAGGAEGRPACWPS